MEKIKERRHKIETMVLAISVVGLLFASYTIATAADLEGAQGLVDRARVTFSEFMRDPNYTWVRTIAGSSNSAQGIPQADGRRT